MQAPATRRRLLEITATSALLATLFGAGGGLLHWRARQERLNTALAAALTRGDLRAVRAHLAAGADIRTRGDDGTTPLMLAISKGDLRCVDELLARGVDLNAARLDDFGWRYTPLHYALQTQNPERLVEKLLQAGANPNVRDGNGDTVLVRAAQSGQTEAVRVLLRYGADVRATGVGSILHVEKVKDHAAVVRLLQEAGARD